MTLDVGAGIAGIASVGRDNGDGSGMNLPALMQSATFWGWVIFLLSVAWLIGLFAVFGGYKGDVAS